MNPKVDSVHPAKQKLVAYRVAEFMQAFGVGRTKVYNLVNSGQLQILKSGRVTLIPMSSVETWMKACEAEARAKHSSVPGKKRA